MKKLLLLTSSIFLFASFANAQVTQINNNNSLAPIALLNNNLAIAESDIDQSIWATDATAGGTIQLSTTIKATGPGLVLNGKYIFIGTTVAEGSEIFISDGTVGGTKIIRDIVAGAAGSTDAFDEMTIFNGFVYFIATTAAEGRELWRTDGTLANTTLVKDIITGPTSSNDPGEFNLTSAGSYLLLDVKTVAEGNELWRSDGTGANTALLKDIITGPVSSAPRTFFPFGNYMLFSTTGADGLTGEVWRTDGTIGGTVLLKDNIVNVSFFSSFSAFFHVFNNRAYFVINDGVNESAIYSTDGIDATAAHTSLLKDEGITGLGAAYGSALLLDAFNLPGKFIFPVTDGATRFELWESDGTTAGGTKLFMSFPPNANSNFPFILVNIGYNANNQTISYPLYNGNFFFVASSATEGYELWKSDGTVAGTSIVKDINPNVADGISNTGTSYFYSTAGLYFPATNGTQGNELWKSDGTVGGTAIVKDININTGVNSGNSDPTLSFFLVNGKIMFTATDGDDPANTDLFVVDGTFTPLPVKLLDFTVTPKTADAVLNWHTSQEINSKNYTVQRSFDGVNFENIGIVSAAGNSTSSRSYSFTDVGIINSGKNVVYYRLMSLDLDGKGTASAIITLKIKSTDQWNVKLLSNPVTEDIKLLLSGFTENMQLSVVDIHGKKLYSIVKPAINGQISLPASGLPKGIYMLVTQTQNERRTIQFVK